MNVYITNDNYIILPKLSGCRLMYCVKNICVKNKTNYTTNGMKMKINGILVEKLGLT